MIKNTVRKSRAKKSGVPDKTQEEASCGYGDNGCCEPECVEAACCDGTEACEGGQEIGCRVGAHAVTPGKKYHGDRLKLLVEVCEKWSLFGDVWKTKFARDAHALIDLGLLEYVKSDNGYMQVRPTEAGMDRYKTIVAGVFGVEVA